MTLQEILKARGMSDEDIASIVSEMKTNKIFTTSHENMDVRYPKLKGDYDTLNTQHGEAAKLIEQYKLETQGKITSYEQQVANLTKELNDQKIEAAMDRKLTSAGAKSEDLDYLKFQWRKKGEITLDDNGEIKNADDAVSGLKTQCPVQFITATDKKELQPHQLPNRNNDGENTVTKEEFNKMGYNSRVKLKESDPELYNQLTKG